MGNDQKRNCSRSATSKRSRLDSTRSAPESIEILGDNATVITPLSSSGNGDAAHHHGRGRHESTDTDTSDISATLERAAPDGGWGWVVVGAAFLVNMIADGVTFSFGVFYVEFNKYFGESKSKTAWIGSLLASIPLISGPIASSLADRFGCRKVTIAGSLLATLGFLLSSQAESIEMLYITFGIITGFGLSLCYVAAVVIVAYYFDQRRSLATGLSVCGGGIGTFLFAPLTAELIGLYGWKGTTLILAGAFLNLCICGALMRDLKWTKKKVHKRPNLSVDVLPVASSEISNLKKVRLCSSAICIPTFVKDQGDGNYWGPHHDPPPLLTPVQPQHNQMQRHLLSSPNNNAAPIAAIHRHSLTYRGAILSLKRYRLRPASSCPDIISVATADDRSTTHEWKAVISDVSKWMQGVCEYKHLSNSRFILFVLSNLLLYMWYDVPYVYLQDAALRSNYSEEKSSYLISFVGFFNMVGNIILGYLGDKQWANATLVYGVCMALCGASMVLMPWFMAWNYVSLATACGIFGLTIAANYSLTSVILVQFVSLERFANAYGLLLLVQGIGNLIGPPIAGVIYDLTDTNTWSFVVAGGGVLASSVFILAPSLWSKKEEEAEEEEECDIE